jgi:hypothetical protein
MAAFANGELMNAIDWNALLPPSHVPPYVVPPALALAEAHHASGQDLICAVATALEISGRVGTSLGGLRATPGGFPLRVWGISSNQLGATAGAAKILVCPASVLRPGSRRYYALPSHTSTTTRRMWAPSTHLPAGSRKGVTTALLKWDTGEHDVLDGEHGFWAMNSAPSVPEGYRSARADGVHERCMQVLADLRMFQSPLDAPQDYHGPTCGPKSPGSWSGSGFAELESTSIPIFAIMSKQPALQYVIAVADIASSGDPGGRSRGDERPHPGHVKVGRGESRSEQRAIRTWRSKAGLTSVTARRMSKCALAAL